MDTEQPHHPHPRLDGFDPRAIFTDDYVPAPSNGLLILHPDQEQVLGRCSIIPFLVRHSESGVGAFRGVTLIAPPRTIWDFDEAAIFEMIRSGISDVRGSALEDAEEDSLRRKLSVLRCETADTMSVLQAIANAQGGQFILMPWFTLYRDAEVAGSASRPHGISVEEDAWVPHTVAIASRILDVAQQKDHFVLMASPVEAPVKASSNQALLNVDGLAVAGLRERTEEELISSVERWVGMAIGGNGPRALAELEARNLPALAKKQAQMQVLAASRESRKAAELIRELVPQLKLSATTAVKWAGICCDADDRETARRLLDGWIDRLLEQGPLEEALQLSTRLRDRTLIERAWSRLEHLFADSETLRFDAELRLLQYCQSARLGSRIGFGDHHTLLAGKLVPNAEVDYSQVLAEMDARFPEHRELACFCAALHAEARGKEAEAVDLAAGLVGESRFSPAAARLLLRVTKALFLKEVGPKEADIYRALLLKLVGHLAQAPQDAALRASLVNAFSVESAGRSGLRILASVAFGFAQEPPEPMQEEAPVDPVEPEEFSAFLTRLGTWMGNHSVLDPRARIPSEVVGGNVAGLLRTCYLSLEQELRECKAIERVQEVEFQAHVLTLLSSHAPSSTYDIDGLRLLAAAYSLFGNHQRARDLAEQIVATAGQTPERKRLAWSAYADVYLRTRNYPDALIGISCALSIDARLPAANLFHEWYTVVRIARELQLTSLAEEMLRASKAFHAAQGMSVAMRHRLEGIGLGLRVSTVPRKDLVLLGELLRDCQVHLEEALELGDEPVLSAFQFAQVAGFYERAGGKIPEDVHVLRDKALTELGDETAAFLRAVAATRPSAEGLVNLHNRMAEARYAADAPTDLAPVGMAAHRLLSPSDPEMPPIDAFVAIELLTDRGLTLASTVSRLMSTWPIQFAKDLVAQEGVAILMLGLDEAGELVAAIADATGTYVVRPRVGERSMRSELQAWAAKYPHRYGYVTSQEGDKEFYTTMARFQVPMPQSDRVLVIAEPQISQLTFNLVLNATGELVGFDTALGMVPSLTWLSSVRSHRTGGDGRRIAWVSHREADQLRTMDVVKAMLEVSLQAHGVMLDTSNKLPEHLDGAQLAVIVAHGQLTSEQRFIHRIVDEDDLMESPTSVARAFGGVELVVLFVCSGGRLDVHPIANTTVGLPKMLLDHGSRTVIASPWPLDSSVPGSWLPVFLEQWEAGASAMDACLAANRHLANRHEREPQRSLAMVVYGDALLRKSSELEEGTSRLP